MNKTIYKKTLSRIHPSDESLERIFEMTQKKYTKNVKKVFIAIAVVLSVLFSVATVANAATDGAVSKVVNGIAESLSKEIRVLINGKEAEYVINTSSINDNEDTFFAEIVVTNVNGRETAAIEIEYSGDEGDYVFSGGEIDIILSDTVEEAFEPTTSESE